MSEEGAPPPDVTEIKDDWLRDFYKECGREVTLAYTTLNQMKNWALVVQAAIVAAIASFARSALPGTRDLGEVLAFPVLVGGVLAYVFTLRFFVRAILCYINLQRWNMLQADIVNYKLLARERPGQTLPTSPELAAVLRKHIQDYYFGWHSPITRIAQVSSNLKLGFGILIVLPVLLLLWGFSHLWDDALVEALVAFAIGATIIEGVDFFTSTFFDMPGKKRKRERDIFPGAGSGDWAYISQWVVLLSVCLIIALRPWIFVYLFGSGPLPIVHTEIRYSELLSGR